MPLRVLIIDDEPLARERIATLLEDEVDVLVVGESGDGRSALRAIRRTGPDVVFLDIQLPELDGFDLLRSVQVSQRPVVVFVTAYDKYALKAFQVHAADYLLKPVDRESLKAALARSRRELRLRDQERSSDTSAAPRGGPGSDRILLKTDAGLLYLKPSEIDWVEAAGNYVCFHVGAQTHMTRSTLREVEERLLRHQFVRIHRSVIVNRDRILRLTPVSFGDYEVALPGGVKLPMSRGYRNGVLRRL